MAGLTLRAGRGGAAGLLPVAAAAAGLAAGLLPWGWLAGALAALLPLAHPVFGLCWLVLAVTTQDVVRLPGGLSLIQAAAPLALAGWVVWAFAMRDERLGLGRTAAAWALLLTALLAATSASPYSPTEGLKELWRWGVALLAWLIAATAVRRPWHAVLLVACLVAAPAANAVLGLAQFWSGDGPPAFRIAANLPFVRAYGTLGQPNSFAGYLNAGWPIALAAAAGATGAAWRLGRAGRRLAALGVAVVCLALWGAAAVMLAALGASFSRGGWVGAGAGALGLLVGLGRRGQLAGLTLVGLALAGLGLGGLHLLPAALAARAASVVGAVSFFDPSGVAVTPENFAVVERMAQIWAGWRMFLGHPLLGVGPGSFSLAYPEVTAPPWLVSRGHAHNYYLHIAAEAGVVGLAAYLALVGCAALDVRDALRRLRGGPWRAALVGLCGMIAAVAGHNLFENLHVLHLSVQIAAGWGLAAALGRAQGEGPGA